MIRITHVRCGQHSHNQWALWSSTVQAVTVPVQCSQSTGPGEAKLRCASAAAQIQLDRRQDRDIPTTLLFTKQSVGEHFPVSSRWWWVESLISVLTSATTRPPAITRQLLLGRDQGPIIICWHPHTTGAGYVTDCCGGNLDTVARWQLKCPTRPLRYQLSARGRSHCCVTLHRTKPRKNPTLFSTISPLNPSFSSSTRSWRKIPSRKEVWRLREDGKWLLRRIITVTRM